MTGVEPSRRIDYAGSVHDEREIAAVVEVLRGGPTALRIGRNVRAMEAGDHVLFAPEDRYEVEVRGDDYIILRERDIHAVAAERLEESSTGLYL